MKNLLLIVLALNSTLSMAGQGCNPLNKQPFTVRKFTNYAPSAGGINGRCGTSASGLNACKYTLEDYMKGSAPSVMGAVPQRGGTSEMFGGMYRAVALEQKLGNPGCIKVIVADHYGAGSNNKSKMDIVTKKVKSNITQKVNSASGKMYIIGRAKGVKATRKVTRALASQH